MSDKYGAAAELPRFPTLIRDAADAAAGDAQPEMPAERGAPPPKFPSMVDVALPRADAVAAANAADGFAPDGRQLAGQGVMHRVNSNEIDESLRKNAVEMGTGERKAREAGEKVWKKEDQEQFDKLLGEREKGIEEDSSWIGGKALLTRVESKVADEAAEAAEAEEAEEAAKAADKIGKDRGNVIGARSDGDEYLDQAGDEVVEDETEFGGDDAKEKRHALAPAGSTETSSSVKTPPVPRLGSREHSGDFEFEVSKRNSLKTSVDQPLGGVTTDELVAEGDASWIGGMALAKAQQNDKDIEKDAFQVPELRARESEREEGYGEQRKGIHEPAERDEKMYEEDTKKLEEARAEEEDEEDEDDDDDDDTPEWAQKTVAAGAGVAGGAAAVGAGIVSSGDDERKRESLSTVADDDGEPEWVKKSRDIKANTAAVERSSVEIDDTPDWVKNRPVLTPSGSLPVTEPEGTPDSRPLPSAASRDARYSPVVESATHSTDRAADLGNLYAGDRIDSDVVAGAADAGTPLDRRETPQVSTALVPPVGDYSSMRDSYSQRSSADSYATATGSALGTAAPPPSTAERTILSGSSYAAFGEASRATSVAQTDFTASEAPDLSGSAADELMFSRPTSAPPPPDESMDSSVVSIPTRGEAAGMAAGAAAIGGTAAAVGGGSAYAPPTRKEETPRSVPSIRAPQVTSVPVVAAQGRPVLSGQWAGEDEDISSPDAEVARRHESLVAGDPGINGAHVNVTRDFGLFGGHTEGVNDAAFVDANTLLTAGQDGKVCVWDISKKYAKSEFVPYEGKAVTMLHVLPPDEDTASWTIMTMSEDRLMRIWNTTLERAVLLHSTKVPPSNNDVVISIPVISAKRRARATQAANAAAAASSASYGEDAAYPANGSISGGKAERKEGGGVFSGTFGLFGRRKESVPA